MKDRETKLASIATVIQSWIDWNIKERRKEWLSTPSRTKMMNVPEFPSIGVLQNWVKVLENK